MNCMQFNETDQQVKLEFKDVSYFSSGEGGTTDHSKLINRDAADQHPMSAITGLEGALAGKQPTGNYLTEEQDPTVPEWAKQHQKPAYTAQEVGALPATTHIPTALSELSEDATHRVVTDAEKAAWNAKSNFSGSYNDLTDKPVIPAVPVQSVNGKTGAVVLSAEDVGALPDSTVIPAPYTLPIARSTVLGGVKPVAKTSGMTQPVGVDATGALYTKAGSGESSDEAFKLIIDTTLTEDVSGLIISEDINGDPFSLKELILFVVQPPIVGQTSNNKISFHPNGGSWGSAGEVKIKSSPKETENTVYSYVHLDTVMGRENVRDAKVSSNYSSVRGILVDSNARTDYSSPYSVKVNEASDELLFGESPFTSVKFNGIGGPIFGSGTRILMWGKTA